MLLFSIIKRFLRARENNLFLLRIREHNIINVAVLLKTFISSELFQYEFITIHTTQWIISVLSSVQI